MIREFDKHSDKSGKKDWRKPWRGKRKSSNFDRSCRNHGGCDWCKSNRTHQDRKARAEAQEQLDEWNDFEDAA